MKTAVVVGAALSTLAQPRAQPSIVLPRADAPRLLCATTRIEPPTAFRAAALTDLASGTPLSFDQEPPLVAADFDGPIGLRNVEIAGDIPAVYFRRPRLGDADAVSVWPRAGSRSVDGRLVSTFELTWTGGELAEALSLWRWGFDNPALYWGSIEVPGSGVSRPVFLRMDLGGIPRSEVVRIDGRAQYASNVVNLVVPGFGDRRVTAGPRGFEFEEAARLFYTYFADEYDVIGIVPASSPLADYGGFHRIVQNRVAGLNVPFVDESGTFGSASILQGIELYAGVAGATYEQTNHETAHQWGSNFDWTRIAGIVRAGHEPSVHAPLWTGGETLLGALLSGDRRVREGAAGFEIERTPAPATFHPIELYAMGALRAAEVPDFGVFVDQRQLDTFATLPPAGTPLRGAVRRVSLNDVVREHGARVGPSPTVWRRATVIVSRDRLLTPREMDFWNFFARRLADGAHADAPTIDGFVPFRAATRNAVALSTAVRPRRGARMPESVDAAATPFGVGDVRGIVFSSPVPRRFAAGVPTTLGGRVLPEARHAGADRVEIVLWRGDRAPIVFAGPVSRTGDFDVTIRATEDQRGPYAMSVFVVGTGTSRRAPAGSLSTVTID